MALSGGARPLHVPAADLLAKNMRAMEQARITTTSHATSMPPDTTSPTLLTGLNSASDAQRQARFRRAATPSRPNPLAALLSRLFSSSSSTQRRDAQQPASSRDAAAADDAAAAPEPSMFAKLLPHLERASTVVSRLPYPQLLFLLLVMFALLVVRLRPHWLNSLIIRLAIAASFLPVLAVALLWRKAPFFAALRENRNPLTHPAEHRLDALEAELAARELRVRNAEETLKRHRAQLDDLRKELAKDPNARIPDAVIVPSRKAAAMIAAGALGAGYDADKAQEDEHRRREESVKRLREEWRIKTEQVDNDPSQANESIKLMEDHAATAYTKRTRELKTRSSGDPGRADKLKNFKRVAQVVVAISRKEEEQMERISRHSERTVSAAATSTTSRRRGVPFFRRKRRGTLPNLDSVLSAEDSPRHGTRSEA